MKSVFLLGLLISADIGNSVLAFATGRVSRTALPAISSRLAVATDPEPSLFIAREDEDDVEHEVPDFDAMMDEDDDDEDYDDDDEEEERTEETRHHLAKPHNRWSNLNSNVKQRWRKNRQDKAKQNNKKESKDEERRRLMLFVKRAEREDKRASRIQRKLPFNMRTPLAALAPGVKMEGQVISLTSYGAYVDIGTECDGLLHISQISREIFVRHPREVLTPGDEIEVQVKSLNPDQKKLQLTLLDEIEDDYDDEDRIQLDEIEVDDELWGEVVRVTDYGAYVELGAAVQGFVHFMDHPMFGAEPGAHPSTYLERGQRIRTWVADVDKDKNRVRLTANRPPHLPGPKRQLY